MHGGAKGSGAPSGERNGAWRHGARSKAAIQSRRETREIIRAVRELVGSAK